MKLGIVGLPNVGKSTLFNALTNAGAQSANYPFCTIDPNVGLAAVPDERLDRLAALYAPKKVTPACVEFVDIAGLVRGASRGEGLGNKFLAHIRETDAIVHVVRCFEGTDVVHVEGSVNPARDIETVGLEMILADLETLGRRADRIAKAAKSAKTDPATENKINFYRRLRAHLEAERPARTMPATETEAAWREEAALLTAKPVIYACNFSEGDYLRGAVEASGNYKAVAAAAAAEQSEIMAVCAELEAQAAQFSPEERQEFLKEIGAAQSGLDVLAQKSYALLGLISFLTAGPPEVRAWAIAKGTKAPQAAGKIHTDMERGFIRAEVVPFAQLVSCGSLAAAREKGLVRSEGKTYVMADGDVVLFRFNV